MTNIQDVLVYRGHLYLPELFEILAKYSYKFMCEQEECAIMRLTIPVALFLLKLWCLCDKYGFYLDLSLLELDELTRTVMGLDNE